MAKRSPILGYNHNVRYRGLVFHVQTEDSGILSPHLFTHLFHGGVIVSTRKLVYDSGAAEDAIKSLMQAQHKAVLKELKRGVFDDKIDEYLGSTPGLEPRSMPAGVEVERPSEPVIEPPGPNGLTTTRLDGGPPTVQDVSLGHAPTLADATERVPRDADAPEGATVRNIIDAEDSAPEIEIRLELDDDPPDPGSGRRRLPHDTELQLRAQAAEDAARSDGIPTALGGSRTPIPRPPDSVPPLPPPPPPDRRPGVVGSALPPRQITRPPARPAISPPQVVSRPISDDRGRRDSDAVEVYAPPPPSAELPAPDRPGEYMQTRGRKSHAIDTLPRDRSGSQPIPSGLSQLPRIPQRASDKIPKITPEPHARPASEGTGERARLASEGIAKSRVPTPPRVTPANASRTPSQGGGGVVMTRPAVIVGAPSKPATTTRPRKAREEEGRGFGQGLISEKSLDEVILAYLSEDAEEK